MSERAPWAVIMAGGSGTRFWPASRSKRPKQLLPLGPDPEESLLAATVRRIRPLVPAERVVVVTGAALAEATRAAVPELLPENVLLEPVGRNTAPCIAWAAAHVARRDPEAVIAVLPSDHTIGDEEGFRGVLARALASAREGTVTTVGIKPTRPETGYGYVETGAAASASGVLSVVRFVEKPDLERAKAYLEGGKHLWNAGMFFFRADAMRALVGRHLPELAAGVERIDRAASGPDAARVLAEVFPTLPSVSIDHGVMEKADRLAVVPGDFGWNDVGSWQSAWELADKDPAGNAARNADVTFVDARGNLVHDLTSGAKKKLFAVVGVEDVVVVETDDAVLVIKRDRAQDVRAAVEAIKARGRADVL
ncbi:MAG: mannose-1-phosphate guanylyltransferase [Myxococcales bacterium]|nr:mannose-1-phosphate guanylyltransferase [Myxococcales bacterium]